MNNTTTMFLVKLSHQWSGYVLMSTVALAFAYYGAVMVRKQFQRDGDPRLRGARAVGRVLGSLTVMSSCVLVVSCLHLGCAALVAQQHICMSNLKLLAEAGSMYAEDYDEHYPAAENWTSLIQPQVQKAVNSSGHDMEGRSVFQCPSVDSGPSYGMNSKVGGISEQSLNAPGETVLLFDADSYGKKLFPGSSISGGQELLAKARHSVPNIAYCDGHVNSMNPYWQAKLLWDPKQVPKP